MSRDPADHHQIVLVEGRPQGLPDRIVNQISFRLSREAFCRSRPGFKPMEEWREEIAHKIAARTGRV